MQVMAEQHQKVNLYLKVPMKMVQQNLTRDLSRAVGQVVTQVVTLHLKVVNEKGAGVEV